MTQPSCFSSSRVLQKATATLLPHPSWREDFQSRSYNSFGRQLFVRQLFHFVPNDSYYGHRIYKHLIRVTYQLTFYLPSRGSPLHVKKKIQCPWVLTPLVTSQLYLIFCPLPTNRRP